MANEEHLRILQEGVEVWNAWRKSHPSEIPDLAGAVLSGASLAGADLVRAQFFESSLRGVNLQGANLNLAEFFDADLQQADLRGAHLGGTSFFWAHLGEADLQRADLRGADFSESSLAHANLMEAAFGHTILGGTLLSDTKGLDSCTHDGPTVIDHETLTLSGPLPITFLRGCGLPENFIDQIPSLFWEGVSQYHSCFISYSHANDEFARRLHDALQQRGIRCWLDKDHLVPGQNIYSAVDRGIRQWDKFLLCCSKSSLTSWWVDNEINTVFEKEQELGRSRNEEVLVLIPLDTDGYLFSDEWNAGYRAKIRSRVAADFRGWQEQEGLFEKQIERVISALRRKR